MIHTTTRRTRHIMRLALLALALMTVLLLVNGCFGGGGPAPISSTQFERLGMDMTEIERTPEPDLETRERELAAEIRNNDDREVLARANFLRGYIAEVRETMYQANSELRDYSAAQGRYQDATNGGTGYATLARYRLGVLGANGLLGSRQESSTVAKNSLRPLTMVYDTNVWVRDPAIAGEGGPAVVADSESALTATLYPAEAATVAAQQLDVIYRTGGGRDATYYRIVDSYVTWFKNISPTYGAALALIFLSLLIKIVTWPLTTAAFRGMRDMQRVQPLLKELQEKYKGDKAKLAEEQMKLMKEHKVSPAGSCLPMLIQLPVFIVVYQAVMVYSAGFAQAQFAWIPNLARPDIPLLILYAASMILTQKLTATPTVDPQQRMMQNQMTYFMPIFLVVVLLKIASAFVLYWFFLNLFSAAHQYYLMRTFRQEEATVVVPAPAPEKKKGKKS